MAKEMIAMLLAGGQGSRLYTLTQKLAKPAVPFGGKYRIIDFPLSNCVNSGIDTVGILTQYRYCVRIPTVSIPEFTQFDSGKSIILYFPPNGTAGFASFCVNV